MSRMQLTSQSFEQLVITYATDLQKFEASGFTNRHKNLKLLFKTNGNTEVVLRYLEATSKFAEAKQSVPKTLRHEMKLKRKLEKVLLKEDSSSSSSSSSESDEEAKEKKLAKKYEKQQKKNHRHLSKCSFASEVKNGEGIPNLENVPCSDKLKEKLARKQEKFLKKEEKKQKKFEKKELKNAGKKYFRYENKTVESGTIASIPAGIEAKTEVPIPPVSQTLYPVLPQQQVPLQVKSPLSPYMMEKLARKEAKLKLKEERKQKKLEKQEKKEAKSEGKRKSFEKSKEEEMKILPEGIEAVYIDGNDLLYVVQLIRSLAIQHNKARAELALQIIAQQWAKLTKCNVTLIFDETELFLNSDGFCVCSARPFFNTSDLALINMCSFNNETASKLVFTSDKELGVKLEELGVTVLKAKHFFQIAANMLGKQEGESVDSWAEKWLKDNKF